MQLEPKKSAKYSVLNDTSSQILPNNNSTIREEKIIHNDSSLVSKILYPVELLKGFSLVKIINPLY